MLQTISLSADYVENRSEHFCIDENLPAAHYDGN